MMQKYNSEEGWEMHNLEEAEFEQDGANVVVKTKPYMYGRQLVVRVAKIEVE